MLERLLEQPLTSVRICARHLRRMFVRYPISNKVADKRTCKIYEILTLLQKFLRHFSKFILKKVYQLFFQKTSLNILKQNIFSKIDDVNEYLKFPYEGFHS